MCSDPKLESVMDNLDFSEEEIQEQLAILGYNNIPKHRLLEFKQDLDDLIRHGEWRSLAPSTRLNHKTVTTTSQPSPPVFTKEKVGRCYIEDTSEGFFLHANRADHDREDRGYGRQQGRCDSYAQHSVAPKLQLPPGAPRRLQVEPDVSPLSRLSDSYTSSSDAQEKRFIKRKVLRKHEGQSLVCDESIYSEDSDAGWLMSTCLRLFAFRCDQLSGGATGRASRVHVSSTGLELRERRPDGPERHPELGGRRRRHLSERPRVLHQSHDSNSERRRPEAQTQILHSTSDEPTNHEEDRPSGQVFPVQTALGNVQTPRREGQEIPPLGDKGTTRLPASTS
ncbi:uncharacterized protein hyls1 isoform X5 [Mugil cephalus]|uniref:uncharacterized protein hyls1 isoform X5 n=1 Tax=Mugil cephalus TaxID=48193 RepID=UPI001FB6B2A9|nr:uncharacterized protein hyls1 isoform X5 [Mugil cephalus]